MPSQRERLTRRQVEGAPSLWSLLSLSRPPFQMPATMDWTNVSGKGSSQGGHSLAPRVLGGIFLLLQPAPEGFVGI